MSKIKEGSLEGLLITQYYQEGINSEFYYNKASIFRQHDLNGFYSLFKKQGEEEQAHKMKFFDYLMSRKVNLNASFEKIPKFVITKNDELIEIIKEALDNEKENSKRIKNLFVMAEAHGDYGVQDFLTWFIHEQDEEENKFNALYKAAKENGVKKYDKFLPKTCNKSVGDKMKRPEETIERIDLKN